MRRRFVTRGRRRYALCGSPKRPARRSLLDLTTRRAVVLLPLAAFLMAVFVSALAHALPDGLPRDSRDGMPVASLAHYSFDDFANAQR